MPALPRLTQDIVDVRIGLARAIGDLFIVGAFYGDHAVPVPLAIKSVASMLAEDDSPEVREIILRISADRWTEQSAASALVEAHRNSDEPQLLADAVSEALDQTGPGKVAEDSTMGMHDRADIPSPVATAIPPELQHLRGEDDEDDVDTVGLVSDPFELSFAAAASALHDVDGDGDAEADGEANGDDARWAEIKKGVEDEARGRAEEARDGVREG